MSDQNQPPQPPQGQPGPYGQQPQGGPAPQQPQGQPGPYGQPPQGPPPGSQPHQQPSPGGPHGVTSPDAKGFFGALFDLSFTSFVTISFAKLIYVMIMVVLVMSWIFFIIAGFATDVWAGFAVLLLGWVPILLYLILARVTLEFYIAMVRTSQNTAATKVEVENLRGELRR
ncbi:DUF4282 domain-containing protein [Zhihengliuella flava]|uniref:DUF4282 domain-containing protein n=1 Tax=Zhihengliuella flava TaxID=1285193 RepID=A0A931GLT1_9MICC|nr:DUF4282 domain-containing protein [Zhihengliuella flava]MBG6084754.1 hypothetical protein [Zhihengliuella flava]